MLAQSAGYRALNFGRFPLVPMPLHLIYPLLSQCTVNGELVKANSILVGVVAAYSNTSLHHGPAKATVVNHHQYPARGGTQPVVSSINPAHLMYVGVVCVFSCPQVRKYLGNVSKNFFAVSTGHYLPRNAKNKETKNDRSYPLSSTVMLQFNAQRIRHSDNIWQLAFDLT